MKALLLPLLAIGICFAHILTVGQNMIKISGRVADVQQQPVTGATVALMKDSRTVKLAVTEVNGSFVFEGGFYGTYQVSVTVIGMKRALSATFTIDTTSVGFFVPAITLEKEGRSLKSVTVMAKKKYIEQKIDRTVVNTDVLISNAGTTALEVLEKAPGVQVDVNGTISLKGSQGVAIYIDNRPAYLSGADLQNYLRSLPASMISQLEIMPNPPAQYDAAGNGGIINIKTIKQTIKGFNLGINISPRIS